MAQPRVWSNRSASMAQPEHVEYRAGIADGRADRRPVGLLAGSGRFPIIFAEKARRLGIPVVCVGIRHEASPELAGLVSRFYWAGVARIGKMIDCFRRENVRHVVMAGKIQKTRMFAPLRWLRLWPDWRTLRFWVRRRRDNRDGTLLVGLVDEFA